MQYGPDAVSYQFAQIGNDLKAQAFLGELDNHPAIGGLIDSTSNYEVEQDEMMRTSGVQLTPEMWLVKLLLGSIDSSYDTKGRSRVRYKANFAKILSRREINEQVLEDGMRLRAL